MRLVFDTSSSWVLAGVMKDGEWVGALEKTEEQSQSKLLFAVLQELLQFYQIPKSAITEIAVGVGPGSYTGLRIGLTVAKIWAFSAKISLYQFSSSALLERTKEKNPDAEHLDLRLITDSDFVRVDDINAIVPVYSNDHFA
jgi:tRNA threonylcarbamoyladenosine biosynthesis protein TsaB